MKKAAKLIYLCVALVLLISAALVGKAYFFPSRVNPILLARIEADYAKHLGGKKEPIAYCYGIYHGCVAVMFDGPATELIWTEEIAGVSIRHGTGHYIWVWKNGSFVELKEAYSQGLLTKEDIETIANKHHKRRNTM